MGINVYVHFLSDIIISFHAKRKEGNSLRLAARCSEWKINQCFENHLQCPDGNDTAGSQNVGLFTFQASQVAVSHFTVFCNLFKLLGHFFCCLNSKWLPNAQLLLRHTLSHGRFNSQ